MTSLANLTIFLKEPYILVKFVETFERSCDDQFFIQNTLKMRKKNAAVYCMLAVKLYLIRGVLQIFAILASGFVLYFVNRPQNSSQQFQM